MYREPQDFIKIYSPGVCRRLLRDGYTLLDVTENKLDAERMDFVFSDPDQEIRKRLYAKKS